jgi:RNA polymerase sigma factor for flagellar operon FliA
MSQALKVVSSTAATRVTSKSSKSSRNERRVKNRTAPGFGTRRGQKLSMGLSKTELIEKYRYKVRAIALKLARDLPASVDVDDLYSMGYLGLMDAADKFDPRRGAKFDTYAEFRIRGAIIDELRKQDWVPRSARDRMDALHAAAEAIEARTGVRPNNEEISQEMDMPLSKFHEMIRDLGSQLLVNMEDMPEGWEQADSSMPDPFQEAVRKEAKAVVERLLQSLPEQDRMVLNFYYYRGLNLKEIAAILGVTESRVSQIHGRAIMALKNGLSQKGQAKEVPAIESVFLALIDD